MGGFNRQYEIFVPVNFVKDNSAMYTSIPYQYRYRLQKKLGESLSNSIMKTAIRRANAIMHNAMKNSSHNGYITNNINRSREYHVKMGNVTYRRFRHNTPLEERSRKTKNARNLLNIRPTWAFHNNLYELGNFTTGVLVRYSINPRKRRVNDT